MILLCWRWGHAESKPCAAGAHLSVFGIEALKAQPAARSQSRKRPRDPPGAQQGSSSADGSKRPRADIAAAAAAADRPEASTEPSPPAGASSSEEQKPGLGHAADSAEAAGGEVKAAKSFSFPVLNGGEGSAPPSIKTPAQKPKSGRGNPRYPSGKGKHCPVVVWLEG